MAYKLLENNVLVKRGKAEEMSPGGIVLPDQAKRRSQRGVVVAVGPGKIPEGKDTPRPIAVNVGDTVVFNRLAGMEIDEGGEKLLLLSEFDILAIIEE